MNTPCLNCDMNCLGIETFSGCIEYNGPEVPALGVSPGMNLNEVILALASVQVQTSSGTTSAKDIMVASNFSTSGGNECLSNIPSSRHTVSFSGDNTNPVMTFDFSRQDLPEGYNVGAISIRGIRSASTNVNGSVFAFNQAIGSVSLTANDFPLIVNVDVQISTPCGPVLTSSSWSVDYPNTGSSFVVVMNPTIYSQSPAVEVSLQDKIRQLENQIQNINLKLNN